MNRLPFCFLIFVLMNPIFVSNAFAQESMQTTTPQVEESAIVEFLTYWQPGFQISNRATIETEYGNIPVQLFSSKYAPKSGGALSYRIIGYRSIGLHLGAEWTSAKALVSWHSPELGISFPEMESEFNMFDLWLGFLYAPFLLDQFPLRPHLNIDAGWMQTSFVLKLNGERVESGPKLHENHFLLRYGLGLDISVVWKIGVVFKYQRYLLTHSQFEPEKGVILEGDHKNPHLLSFGLTIRI